MAGKGERLTNEEVRTDVANALVEDPRTADAAIEVIAEQGIVTLRGQVPSREVRVAAEEIAKGKDGVVQVINDLSIEPPEEELVPDVHPIASKESRPPIIPV
jgi:osmotically-inducible protein OsmY